MKRFLRSSLALVLLAGAVVSCVLLRWTLLRERVGLGVAASGWIEEPGLEARGPFAASGIFLSPAVTGVFRALAIDYLWIRAVRQQEQGRFFEFRALATLITHLEPRLATVWRFQARNLAYNITVALPPKERYSWVLEAIALLRDRALAFNPANPGILLDLAQTFQHKIGLDFDEAGYLYRSELARTFDLDRDSPAPAELLLQWGIRPEHRPRVEAKWGAPFDFRVAEAHALYWADLGLASPRAGEDELTGHQLRITELRAIQQLFSGGRPVKAPVGRLYAFVPDLRFAGACRRALEREIERSRRTPERHEIFKRLHEMHLGKTVYFLYLFGREAEARALFEEIRANVAPSANSLEGFLLERIAFLPGGDTAPASPGGETSPGGASAVAGVGPARERSVALGYLASFLDAALYLDLAGEVELGRGFRALARLVHSREEERGNGSPGELKPFDAYVNGAALRLLSAWKGEPAVWRHVPDSLKAKASEGGPEAESLGLPKIEDLPFRLELLDPLRGGNRP